MSLKVYAIAGAAITIVTALTASHIWAYRSGRAVEQATIAQRIAKENEDAGNRAEDWRARLRRCVDAGGLFDFETGSCDR